MKRLAALALLVPAPALAHAGESHGGWTFEVPVAAPLAASALLYAIGARRLWSRSFHGRATQRRQTALFCAGWIVLAASLVSPLHESGQASFAIHMVEHELIMLPAALLLVASRPGAAMLWALPAALRSGLGGAARGGKPVWHLLTDPVVATFVQLAVLFAWHAPALFDRALASEGWHVAQHLSFLASALLFWWALAHGRSGRFGFGTASLCLFLTSLAGGALGALMAFSTRPWYAGYAVLGMTSAGLSAAQDQQLAGLIMWIPGGLFHAAGGLFFLWKWIRSSETSHAFAE
ncbi:MAG TPA: cytochrome c oxidase assembly protein [Allosphingosinicella sp.]|jgi:cytochrome c oxidase assembly factor CtaG